MDMATLGELATKAAVNCSAVIGRKLLTGYQRNKIATEAAGILVAGNTERFIEHLNPRQLRGFREFAESAQFDHLVRQAMISSLASTTDNTRSAIREQLRHGLRHHGKFAEADLLQATDVLHELVDAAVHAVRQTAAPGTLDNGRAVAMAARVAAAGILNSELLYRLKRLDEVNQFAKAVRSAAKAGHAKLRMAAHDLNRQVDYAQLYVTPVLRPAAASPLWDASTSKTFTLADGMNNAVRFVILGDPGAGKSTLAAKLAHDLAADKIGGLEGQVPILLVVRAHTQSLRTDHHTLLHYLEAACRRPGNVNPPPDALEYLLLTAGPRSSSTVSTNLVTAPTVNPSPSSSMASPTATHLPASSSPPESSAIRMPPSTLTCFRPSTFPPSTRPRSTSTPTGGSGSIQPWTLTSGGS